MRCAIAIPLVMVSLISSAQEDIKTQYQQKVGDYASLYQGRLSTPIDRSEWVGDPYLDGEEWKIGQISFNGILYTNVMLRLDIMRQELVVCTPDKRFSIVPDKNKVDYIIVNDQKYIYINNKIVRVDYDGDNVKLVYFVEKVRGTSTYIDRHAFNTIATSEAYYVAKDNSLIKVKNDRKLIKLFPEYKSKIKEYVKSNSTPITSQVEKMIMAINEADTYINSKRNLHQNDYDTITNTVPLTEETNLAEINMIALDSHKHRDWEYEDDNMGDNDDPGVDDFKQTKEDKILDEVVVRGIQERVSSIHVGMEKFRPALLKNMPLALGEADVMKMIQTLPGIKSVGEASSGYNVRGGASDQNLILFNNATIYNPMHLFGVFSAFNSDMINDAELYKSSIPSQYGGRISSVLNITPKMADKRHWHGQASISLLTSKATLEAPLVKDKVSLLVSGRTTYSDWMLNLLPENSTYKDGSAGFYDLGGVLSWTVNNGNRINAYGYYSKDRFSFDKYNKYAYSNRNASIDWRSLLTDNLTSIVSVGIDHYEYQNDDTEVETEAARLSFAIDQYFLKGVITHVLNDDHSLKYGWNAIAYDIKPGKYEPIGDRSLVKTDEIDDDKAIEGALFAEDTWKATEKITVNGGLRMAFYHSMADNAEMTHVAPEFRLSANYAFTEKQAFKLGFNSMHQYIHKVSNSLIMSPTDIWKLSDDNIKPQSGWQIAGGYFATFKDIEVSAEGYFKKSDNYLTYKNAGQILMNHELHNDVVGTKGKAYGVEVQLRKPTGRINGWISYGYSRTFQKDTQSEYPINDSEWFPTEHDRPHEFKAVANYKITKRYSFSCNMDYSSGRATTVPAGKYYDNGNQKWYPYYTKRNGYRMPNYFRVDASFNIEPNHHLTQKVHSSFSMGLYNVTGRRNAYSIYHQVEGREIKGYKLSIFGAPIPFITYNIKF